jgi:hypothetical protein
MFIETLLHGKRKSKEEKTVENKKQRKNGQEKQEGRGRRWVGKTMRNKKRRKNKQRKQGQEEEG